jgi:DNA (cytosine-5)-methyltransferase 1
MSKKLRFIDLFAGIGGIRLPFQKLGGECVFTSEFDKFAQKTYERNFGEIPSGDITQINSKDIPSHDLLLGGFPCQAFSGAGYKRGFNDTRGTLFFDIQRIIAHHQPAMFLLENVKQLKSNNGGKTFETIINILSGENFQKLPQSLELNPESKKSLNIRLNYNVGYKIISANDHGVCQKRERIYIIGFNKKYFKDVVFRDAENKQGDLFDKEKLQFIWPKKVPLKKTLKDILYRNKDVDTKYTLSDKLWAGHQIRKKRNMEKGNGFSYGLFNHNDKYTNTISARYYKDGSEILICQKDIKKNPRKLTPRECARIQGYPESFKLDAASDVQLYRQFGNSVSVPVIKKLAKAMINVYEQI